MEMKQKGYLEQGLDLKRLMLVLGRKLWLIVVGAIVGACVGICVGAVVGSSVFFAVGVMVDVCVGTTTVGVDGLHPHNKLKVNSKHSNGI